MEQPNTVTDYKGNIYESETAMCKAYGVHRGTYRSRIKMGWSQQEALNSKAGDSYKNLDKPIVYNGQEFYSYNSLAKALGTNNEYIKQTLEKGFTIDEIVLYSKQKVRMTELTFDHLGNRYPSKLIMAKAYGKSAPLIRQALAANCSLEEALTLPDADLKLLISSKNQEKRKSQEDTTTTDHLGNVFVSQEAKCEYYGIAPSKYRFRLRHGWTEEEALLLPINHRYEDPNKRTDHLGNRFISIKKMCEHYNIQPAIYNARIRKGWSMQDALTTPVVVRKNTQSDKLILNGQKYQNLNELSKKLGRSPVSVQKLWKQGLTNEQIMLLPKNSKTKSTITGPDGKIYASEKAMCKAYNISQTKYRTNIKKGMDMLEALKSNTSEVKKVYMADGTVFESIRAFYEHYNLSPTIVRANLNAGWTPEEIIEGKRKRIAISYKGIDYPSIKQMCSALGFSYSSYYDRIKNGLDPVDAINDCLKVKERQVYDHKGQAYPSIKAMCKAYHITEDMYFGRMDLGWDMEKALTTPRTIVQKMIGTVRMKKLAYICDEPNYYCECKKCGRKDIWTFEEAKQHICL